MSNRRIFPRIKIRPCLLSTPRREKTAATKAGVTRDSCRTFSRPGNSVRHERPNSNEP